MTLYRLQGFTAYLYSEMVSLVPYLGSSSSRIGDSTIFTVVINRGYEKYANDLDHGSAIGGGQRWTNRLGPMQHGDPGGRVSALSCLCSKKEPDSSELMFQEIYHVAARLRIGRR